MSAAMQEALEDMERRKDAAYEERNKVVAALARLFPSGVCRTNIPGWSDDWHCCVRIDLPTGQVSWHFHDSQAYLFDGLPAYTGEWDGHDTPEKYRRLAALTASSTSVPAAERARIVAYLRSFAKRVEPKSASANNINAAADAIESGNAFFAGNPDAAFTASPPPFERDQHQGETLREQMDKALAALDSYADPTSYRDIFGEYYEAGATSHPGIYARDTAAEIRAALSSTAPKGGAA